MNSNLELRLKNLEKSKEVLAREVVEEKNRVRELIIRFVKKRCNAKGAEIMGSIDDFLSGCRGEIVRPVEPSEPWDNHNYRDWNPDLNKIRENYSRIKRNIDGQVQRIDRETGFIKGAMSFGDKTLKIEKADYVSEKPFYSLRIGNSPVFLYDGENLRYICTTRKNGPFGIKTAPAEKIIGKEKLAFATSLLSLKKGDFCDENGYRINGDNQNVAADIFEQVMTGRKILPEKTSVAEYGRKEESSEEPKEQKDKFRHWGQLYLAHLSPDKIVEGQLLGSAGSYKAYFFGDKTVVEFDQPDRATYFFDSQYFDQLRKMSRSELLLSCPQGFEGRAIHHDNRNKWKSNVETFIN